MKIHKPSLVATIILTVCLFMVLGAKMDRHIETLELRITAIERGHVLENGVETCRQKDCPICNR